MLKTIEEIRAMLTVLVVVGVSFVTAQQDASCRSSSLTPRHSLDISRYMGDWYLHERAIGDKGNYPKPWWKCSMHQLSLINPNDTLSIKFHDDYLNATDGSRIKEDKWITVNDSNSPLSAIWTMTSEDIITGETMIDETVILAADLEFAEWTVVYACSVSGVNLYRNERIWGLSRSREISPRLKGFLQGIMVGYGFDREDFKSIDHTNCDYISSSCSLITNSFILKISVISVIIFHSLSRF